MKGYRRFDPPRRPVLKPLSSGLLDRQDFGSAEVAKQTTRTLVYRTGHAVGDFRDIDALHPEPGRDRHDERKSRRLAEQEGDERMELRGTQHRERHSTRR